MPVPETPSRAPPGALSPGRGASEADIWVSAGPADVAASLRLSGAAAPLTWLTRGVALPGNAADGLEAEVAGEVAVCRCWSRPATRWVARPLTAPVVPGTQATPS